MKKKNLFTMIAAPILALGGFAWYSAGRKNHPAWDVLEQYRYAHRGYHDKPEIPENSMPAFRRALNRGWGAELDVHLLKDGTLAVFHDSDLKRCTGADGVIEDLTYEELAQLRLEGTDNRVPLFNEVLDLFEGHAPLIIELKPYKGNHKALAAAVVDRLDFYSGDYCIESFDPRALAEVRRLRPFICRGQLAENFEKDEAAQLPDWQKYILTRLLMNWMSRPDFVAYKFEDRNNLALKICRLRGIHEIDWTIASKKDMETAEKDGALVIFERFDPEA